MLNSADMIEDDKMQALHICVHVQESCKPNWQIGYRPSAWADMLAGIQASVTRLAAVGVPTLYAGLSYKTSPVADLRAAQSFLMEKDAFAIAIPPAAPVVVGEHESVYRSPALDYVQRHNIGHIFFSGVFEGKLSEQSCDDSCVTLSARDFRSHARIPSTIIAEATNGPFPFHEKYMQSAYKRESDEESWQLAARRDLHSAYAPGVTIAPLEEIVAAIRPEANESRQYAAVSLGQF